ncbi:MAG: hypothetical protein A4E19_05995 [Nitrospira sp. SG-bin1]|nr:MAG: hypothetical protein A4E19_05995 [Nitrospira sp. SG-bin1]
MGDFDSLLGIFSLGWVGSVIGLLGIAIAIFIYLRTRQRTRLAFAYTAQQLLGSTGALPRDITLQFRGKEITKLTRTLVLVWNSGENTILADQIVSSDPLQLVFAEGSQVLSATVLKQTRAVNQLQTILIPEPGNSLFLRFEYLDTGDGALIEVLHTSDDRFPLFLGTIRGMPKGIEDLGNIRSMSGKAWSFRMHPRIIAWANLIGGILMVAVGIFPTTLAKMHDVGFVFSSPAFALAAGSAYILLSFFILYFYRRKYPKALQPDTLLSDSKYESRKAIQGDAQQA